MGGFRPGINRPIIANFLWYGDISAILSAKKSLPKGIYVKEDIPKVMDDRNRILRPYSKAANALHMKSSVNKGKLRIDCALYTCDDLHQIAQEVISTMNHEKEDKEKMISFGPQSVFSNMNNTSFVIDNITYKNCEQYIQS